MLKGLKRRRATWGPSSVQRS